MMPFVVIHKTSLPLLAYHQMQARLGAAFPLANRVKTQSVTQHVQLGEYSSTSGSRRRTNEGLKSVASLQGAATRFRETKGELGRTLASSAIGAIETGKQECFHGCQSEGFHNNSCKKLAKGYGYYQLFPCIQEMTGYQSDATPPGCDKSFPIDSLGWY